MTHSRHEETDIRKQEFYAHTHTHLHMHTQQKPGTAEQEMKQEFQILKEKIMHVWRKRITAQISWKRHASLTQTDTHTHKHTRAHTHTDTQTLTHTLTDNHTHAYTHHKPGTPWRRHALAPLIVEVSKSQSILLPILPRPTLPKNLSSESGAPPGTGSFKDILGHWRSRAAPIGGRSWAAPSGLREGARSRDELEKHDTGSAINTGWTRGYGGGMQKRFTEQRSHTGKWAWSRHKHTQMVCICSQIIACHLLYHVGTKKSHTPADATKEAASAPNRPMMMLQQSKTTKKVKDGMTEQDLLCTFGMCAGWW